MRCGSGRSGIAGSDQTDTTNAARRAPRPQSWRSSRAGERQCSTMRHSARRMQRRSSLGRRRSVSGDDRSRGRKLRLRARAQPRAQPHADIHRHTHERTHARTDEEAGGAGSSPAQGGPSTGGADPRSCVAPSVTRQTATRARSAARANCSDRCQPSRGGVDVK